jgi:hypothetical protein
MNTYLEECFDLGLDLSETDVLNESFDPADILSNISNFFNTKTKSSIENDIKNGKEIKSKYEKTLIENNIDVDALRAKIKRKAEIFVKDVKHKSVNESYSFTLNENSYDDLIKKAEVTYLDVLSTFDEFNLENVGYSVILALIVFSLDYFVTYCLMLLLGNVGGLIAVILISPFIENYLIDRIIKDKSGLLTYYQPASYLINLLKYISVPAIFFKNMVIAETISLVTKHLVNMFQKFGFIKDMKKGMSKKESGQFEFYISYILRVLIAFLSFGLSSYLNYKSIKKMGLEDLNNNLRQNPPTVNYEFKPNV